MDEKRVKEIIETIEILTDEIERAAIKWIEEDAHSSCIVAMELCVNDLGHASQHLKSIVS